MKIDLTEKECDLITLTLIRTVTNYEKREQKNSFLDNIMDDYISIIGKLHTKRVDSGSKGFSFEGQASVDDIDSFVKLLEEKLEKDDE